MALSKILDEITSLCERGLKANPLDPVTLCDPDFVRPRIAYRLVNAASNAELLKKLPHIPVLDLAKIFYLYAGQDAVSYTHLAGRGNDLSVADRGGGRPGFGGSPGCGGLCPDAGGQVRHVRERACVSDRRRP